MNRFVLDSSAWIEYFNGSEKGLKIQKYIEQGEVYSHGLIVAEVSVSFLKRGYDPLKCLIAIQSISKNIEFQFDLGLEAAKIYFSTRKNNPKFSLADAIILKLAGSTKATVISCDNDFRGFKDAIVVG